MKAGVSAVVVAIVLAAGCNRQIERKPSQQPLNRLASQSTAAEKHIEVIDGVVIESVDFADVSHAQSDKNRYPLSLEVRDDQIVCRYFDAGFEAKYLTFEERNDNSAYGVYGLEGLKNRIAVPFPLRGEPIDWDNIDHNAALVRLPTHVGIAQNSAKELVEKRASAWFRPGLRIFFVIKSEFRQVGSR